MTQPAEDTESPQHLTTNELKVILAKWEANLAPSIEKVKACAALRKVIGLKLVASASANDPRVMTAARTAVRLHKKAKNNPTPLPPPPVAVQRQKPPLPPPPEYPPGTPDPDTP